MGVCDPSLNATSRALPCWFIVQCEQQGIPCRPIPRWFPSPTLSPVPSPSFHPLPSLPSPDSHSLSARCGGGTATDIRTSVGASLRTGFEYTDEHLVPQRLRCAAVPQRALSEPLEVVALRRGDRELLLVQQAVGEVVQPQGVGLGAVPLPLTPRRLLHAAVGVALAVPRRAREQLGVGAQVTERHVVRAGAAPEA